MKYEVAEDRNHHGDWRVEAIDPDDGGCYVAIFSGVKTVLSNKAKWAASAIGIDLDRFTVKPVTMYALTCRTCGASSPDEPLSYTDARDWADNHRGCANER